MEALHLEKHKYENGRKFNTKKAESPEEYLETALEAEKFLAKYRREDADGIFWTKPRGDSFKGEDLTLYSGTAGVLAFYLKLCEVTGDGSYESLIRSASVRLARKWRSLEVPDFYKAPSLKDELSPNHGLGGLAYVLLEAEEAFPDAEVSKALDEIERHYAEVANRDAAGNAFWGGDISILSDAGVLQALAALYRRSGSAGTLELIKSAGEHYVSLAKEEETGVSFTTHDESYFPQGVVLPNYEFGTPAGGFTLSLLYDLTGEARYLALALESEKYFETLFSLQGKGFLVPYSLGQGRQSIFYFGNCGGPVGNSRFYAYLYRLTKDERYLHILYKFSAGLDFWGGPQVHSEGYWNVGFCCGTAGLLQFYIGLYLYERRPEFLELAREAAEVILGEKDLDEEGCAYWPMPWERIKPDEFFAGIGYFEGAAGVATSLLQLYALEKGIHGWKRWIDDPLPAL